MANCGQFRLITLRFCLAAFLPGMLGSAAAEPVAHPVTSPKLAHTCLITADVERLVNFYENILGIKARRSGGDYAEFTTGASVLAIFSFAAQEKYIPGSSRAAANHSLVLEFQVLDTDQEYRRLHSIVKTWVKPPTTQPWGTRSIYFRGPDGNPRRFLFAQEDILRPRLSLTPLYF
jgi:catechol 2,3-dioxygenase-like lactoylglutathione lyase family enzyme